MRVTQKLCTLWLLISLSNWLSAQTKEQTQVWIGLMTQTRMGKKSLWWNDFHYVPESFLVLRTGYTHELKYGRLTVGLAHLWLPDGKKQLKRQEWRPWAQWFWIYRINDKNQTQLRLRYEARFREKVAAGIVQDDEFDFNHRFRVQFTWRYNLFNISAKDKLFAALGGEILLNQGGKTHYLDQHRRNLTVGVARKKIIFQTGYMNRQNFRNDGSVAQISHHWVNWLIVEF